MGVGIGVPEPVAPVCALLLDNGLHVKSLTALGLLDSGVPVLTIGDDQVEGRGLVMHDRTKVVRAPAGLAVRGDGQGRDLVLVEGDIVGPVVHRLLGQTGVAALF